MKNRFLKSLASVTLILALLIATASPAFAKVGNVYKVNSQGARLRSDPEGGAGHDTNIIQSLPKGAKVVHLSSSGRWWRVRTATGKVGFVFSTYLDAASSSAQTVRAGRTYTVKASTLIVRKSASTGAKRIGALRKGSTVKVLSVSNGWAKISKNGRTGFVAARYLR